MTPDLFSLAISDHALGDDLRRAPLIARKLGAAGIMFAAATPRLDFTQLSASGRREILHVLRSQDQQLVGLRFELGKHGFGPGADVDQLLARLDRVMESAAGLGSVIVCVDLGPLPPPPPRPRRPTAISAEQAGAILVPETLTAIPAPDMTTMEFMPPKVDPIFVAQVDAAMAELGAIADRYSATLAFASELASFAALAEVLRKANCPWFGVDLDPSAALRDDWTLDEIFAALGPLIRHVRGRDAIGTLENTRTQPVVIGNGQIPWPQVLHNLDAAGYHGWITIDPIGLTDRLAGAAEGIKCLRAIR
ncbi:MAG TPA: TIM barrel protein [Tepidisphaeraceae bacterium]|jgi:sugar phosphate isomerase/epimerase|nr:TIM barrel protein [Tepidisphaeraceae bacterium]